MESTLLLNNASVKFADDFFKKFCAFRARDVMDDSKSHKIKDTMTELLNTLNAKKKQIREKNPDLSVGIASGGSGAEIYILADASLAADLLGTLTEYHYKGIVSSRLYSLESGMYAYVLNALAKYFFEKRLPYGSVAARGGAVSFLQKSKKNLMEVQISFAPSKEEEQVKIIVAGKNLKESKDPKPYEFAVDPDTDLLYVLGNKAEKRYARRKGRIGQNKITQFAFLGSEDAGWEEYSKTYTGSSCVSSVLQMLNSSSMCQIALDQVECHSPGFDVVSAIRKRNEQQEKRAEQEERTMKSRMPYLTVSSTDNCEVSDILLPELKTYLSIYKYEDSDFKPSDFIKEYKHFISENGMTVTCSVPCYVDFQCGQYFYKGCTHDGKTWLPPKKKNGEYYNVSSFVLYFLYGTDGKGATITVSVEDNEGNHVAKEYQLKLPETKTPEHKKAKYSIILQKDDKDKDYQSQLTRQYITEKEQMSIKSYKDGITITQKLLKELLLVKADIHEKKALGFPNGRDWSCIWHKTTYDKEKDKRSTHDMKMDIDHEGNITLNNYAYPDTDFVVDEEEISKLYDYWNLISPEGKQYFIQKSDLRQVLADMDGVEASKGRYTRSKKLQPEAIIKQEIQANTSYKYFRYRGGDYYLVGWDNSQNYRQTYHHLSGIYRVFSENGELTADEWKEVLSLCDVGFVRSTSESTVVPAFAKYLREFDRVENREK